MADALKAYQIYGASYDEEGLKLKSKDGKPFRIYKGVLDWNGTTVWERNHPTFISKKRKVILTCPRKVGHSSIRFYLSYMNSHFDDDWHWLEGADREPESILSQEELSIFYEDLYSDNEYNKKICLVGKTEGVETDDTTKPFYYGSTIIDRNEIETVNNCFGKDSDVTWVMQSTQWHEDHETTKFPPWQTLKPFSDYKTYLIVRDPWDRFISGLITEMDNGLLNPWKYETDVMSQSGWEKLYTSAKRILYFTEPEQLALGGLYGPQANHTFILGRPLWKGKSMYDEYDVLVDFKHELEFVPMDARMTISEDSLKNSAGIIDSLLHYGFVNQEIVDIFHKERPYEMYQHTHINVTPYVRQHVVSELQDDEDLKEWWNRCRELVNIDYELLKNNKHKIEKT